MRAHIPVRIMKISAVTVDRIFSGTNHPNPQVMDSTPSAARQSHAPISRARGKELWFPHFQNDGSRAEFVAKWRSDGMAEKLTELLNRRGLGRLREGVSSETTLRLQIFRQCRSVLPEILEPQRAQFGISHGVLNILVP